MNHRSWVTGRLLAVVLLSLPVLSQTAARAVTDTTPPTGTIVINNNRSATNSPAVTLTLAWDDGADGTGVSRMRFSDDGAHWSAWETLQAARAHTLPAGDGHKTVRVQYLDRANNRSAVFSDYILLDTTPPTGTISINGGAATTVSLPVSLRLGWSDGTGVSRMRFSGNGSTWTVWETPAATRAHTLPAGLGYHTVRVQYLDSAGNYSPVCSDYVKVVAKPGPGTAETLPLPGGVPLTMLWIPGGSFGMGRYLFEQDSYDWEDPQHTVTLNGFWMAQYELTKRQWNALMSTRPWAGQEGNTDLDSPAVQVSFDDMQAFITALNTQTGKSFRIPSETQWEYGCRAGTTTRFYWGDDSNAVDIDKYCWYAGNCATDYFAHVVGTRLPNAFGLCDMSGNLVEWCADDWHENYSGAPDNDQAWVDEPRNVYRVVRGGSWLADPDHCRSAWRFRVMQDTRGDGLGGRIVRMP